ncbi:hypothetical protein [Mesorhizobium sophorae]|uniref:hypothetical protein n=1 Tax=Mesorhizobium sophorae TaxID=1300294 RepID=UPI00117C4B00|nr:hypothetical protein [Mesorhizobium sophorae]
MLDLSKIREREKGLLQRKAKLESDLVRLKAQEKKAARKDDTRRKIVIGGALFAAIDAGVIPNEIGRKLVGKFVAERDKKMFDGSPLAADQEAAVLPMPDGDPRE